MNPAQSYAIITVKVAELVERHTENDPERACYMVARAALLVIRARSGSEKAAEAAFKLADELATERLP